jgi:hypothetical protein
LTHSSIDTLPEDTLHDKKRSCASAVKLLRLNDWSFLARAGQRPPDGDWRTG